MKPLLDITDVSLSYHSLSGETPALSHISFQLMPGEFLAIAGPSGCGKSTLLNLICGLLRPEQGQILLDGTPVTSGDCRIGYMLQNPDDPNDVYYVFINPTGTATRPNDADQMDEFYENGLQVIYSAGDGWRPGQDMPAYSVAVLKRG